MPTPRTLAESTTFHDFQVEKLMEAMSEAVLDDRFRRNGQYTWTYPMLHEAIVRYANVIQFVDAHFPEVTRRTAAKTPRSRKTARKTTGRRTRTAAA